MTTPFKGRREDTRLVTGAGRYSDDWRLPGEARGVFLRADRAHAAIRSIDTTAAAAAPGVVGVFTGEDVMAAGFKNPQPIAFFTGRNGSRLKVPPRPMLAVGRVRFVGEAVALVVAETEVQALDAVELIAIDYEDLPAVIDARDAVAEGAPLVHDDIAGNLALDYDYGDADATDAAIAAAELVVQVEVDAQRIAGNPMEPKSGVAAWDAATGSLDLWVPSQGMTTVLEDAAHITGLPPEKVRVHPCDVGGAFGIRGEAYPEYLALALAARALGRPVRWTGTRAESLVSDHHGRASRLKGELALDRDGTFRAIRVAWLTNNGAYCSNAGAFTNTAAAPRGTAINIYRIPAAYGRHRVVFTNTTPTTAYRGAARPSVAYLAERLVEEAARASGIDAIELRRRNLIPKEAFPYATPTGSTYDSGDPPGLLAEALRHADWDGFAARRAEAERHGKLRGIGCAMFIEPSGGQGREETAIRFDADGRIDLFALAGPSGQGHETVFPELVGEVLGIDPARITLRYSDPDGPRLVGTGTFGSRSLMNHGGGLVAAAREVVTKAKALAAERLEVAADDLAFESGRFSVPGTDLGIGLDELIRTHAGDGAHPLDTQLEIAATGAFPSGAHIAEVEIDRDTGALEILSYTAVDDCGRVINPTLVEGQLVGGMMQGIGQVIGEEFAIDRQSGQVLTGSFMDYYMPHADVAPVLSLHDHPTLSPTNALGAKGAGEAGTTGSVPTIANAVLDALAPLGVTELETPYSPARLWAAIHAADGPAEPGEPA